MRRFSRFGQLSPMKQFFSPSPLWQSYGIFLIRVVIGVFLIIHGREVFDNSKMQEYVAWDNFKTSAFLPYLGKGAEFVAGILLILGLFTRLAALIIICTFVYITFMIGNGKFWMDDQHPFLFAIIGLMFFFTGPGALSVDAYLFRQK
jgi:putative oxidoreductase